MIETGQDLLQMALTTAAIGMTVVFSALFLLSVYMHYFKIFIAKVEQRHHAPPVAGNAAPSPPLEPAPDAPAHGSDEAARAAAAIAVGLRLKAGGTAPDGAIAAAIAAALACHRARVRAGLQRGPGASSWTMAGRAEAMAARVRRQER